MGFSVDNIGKLFAAGNVSGLSGISETEKLNSVFKSGGGHKYVPNTPFNAEEQHTLSIIAAFPEGMLLIEE